MYGFGSFYPNLFLLLFLFYTTAKQLVKKEENLYNLTCLFLILMAGFRSNTVGGDLEYYIPHFQAMCNTKTWDFSYVWSMRYEPGYAMIVKIISIISNNEQVFLIVTSILSLIGPFYLIKKYSKCYYFSLFYYIFWGLYTNTYNNLRQSIALSICCIALTFVFERKWVKFLVAVLISTTCHYSAIFFILVYPLSFLKLNLKNSVAFISIGSIFISTMGLFLMSFLAQSYFVKYEDFDFEDTGKGFGMLALYGIISIISLYLYLKNKNRQITIAEDSKMSLYLYLLLTATLVQYLSHYFPSMLRLTYYFYIPAIIGITNVITTERNESVRTIIRACMLFYLYFHCCHFIYAYSQETMSNSQGVIPYTMF